MKNNGGHNWKTTLGPTEITWLATPTGLIADRLGIEHRDDRFELMVFGTGGHPVLGVYPTLEGAKTAYLMFKAAGHG